MKTIKDNAKDKANVKQQECNYSNNYYGDQVCVAKSKGGN